MERLEHRMVLCADLGGGHVDGLVQEEGLELHVLDVLPTEADLAGEELPAAAGELLPLSETFRLHSNPTADHVIYLDFDGHTTSGTGYNNLFNGGDPFDSPAYDFDGDESSFSSAEMERIQTIWQRVSEDFSPFDVDVTTEAPTADRLVKSGGGDSHWGVRVVIGGNAYDWYGSGAAGVGYVNSFTSSIDLPVFVFEDNLGNGSEKHTAEAIGHEAGHSLGLNHDGRPGDEYYSGHGSGEVGWAPIMGNGYSRNVTQWSRGEYADANNTEDDLDIITTRNGFGYRSDDHGDSNGSASLLTGSGGDLLGEGIIETGDDVDVFRFSTGAGPVQLDIEPFVRGPNLDVLARLYDASNDLIMTSNPSSLLSASFDLTLAAGIYYLHVTGTGAGDPGGTGYTDYASLGQYEVSGSIVPDGEAYVSIAATDAVKAEGDSGSTSLTFTVTRTDSSGTAAVDYAVSGDGGNPAGGSDFVGGALPAGTVTFAAGESTKTITLAVAGDSAVEADEGVRVTLSNPTGGAQLASSSASGMILNDDVPASAGISVTPTSGLTTRESGTQASFDVVLESRPTANVVIQVVSGDPSEGTVNKSSLTFTTNNWSSPQTVTITGTDDSVRDGHVTYAVELTVSSSSDNDYAGLNPDDVQVTNQDDEKGGRGGGGGGGDDDGGGGNGNGKGKNKPAEPPRTAEFLAQDVAIDAVAIFPTSVRQRTPTAPRSDASAEQSAAEQSAAERPAPAARDDNRYSRDDRQTPNEQDSREPCQEIEAIDAALTELVGW